MAMSLKARLNMESLYALRREFRAEFEDFTETMAKRGAANIKRRIYAQSYGHAPLNPLYRKRKKRHGLDTRILIATGAYVASIEARRQNKHQWIIAPRPGASHGRRAMSTIGLWLEYGTRRMPARPHFRPEAAKLRKEMMAEAKKRASKIGKGVKGVQIIAVGRD